jgi:DNA replication protein DnaC
MQPSPDLAPKLKKLKLSGMMDSLESRNKQAIEQRLAYTEFLALLLDDECSRRESRKFATKMRQAGFRSHKTLEDFDFDFNPSVNKAFLYDLATCRFVREKVCVLIAGPCGTGKSHIAQALGHYAVRQGFDVLFTTQTKLFSRLQAARATGTYGKWFRVFSRVPLLIIDDFGLKPIRPPHDEDFHELIAERYERQATILTSNLDFAEWEQAFANKLLGSSTVDRLRHNAHLLTLEGRSYRSPKMQNPGG